MLINKILTKVGLPQWPCHTILFIYYYNMQSTDFYNLAWANPLFFFFNNNSIVLSKIN